MGDCHTAILHIISFRDNIQSLFLFFSICMARKKAKATNYLFIVCEFHWLFPNFFLKSKHLREWILFWCRMVWGRKHALHVRSLWFVSYSSTARLWLHIFNRGRWFLHNIEILSSFNILWFFDRVFATLFLVILKCYVGNCWLILILLCGHHSWIQHLAFSSADVYLKGSREHPYLIYSLQPSQWNLFAGVFLVPKDPKHFWWRYRH